MLDGVDPEGVGTFVNVFGIADECGAEVGVSDEWVIIDHSQVNDESSPTIKRWAVVTKF